MILTVHGYLGHLMLEKLVDLVQFVCIIYGTVCTVINKDCVYQFASQLCLMLLQEEEYSQVLLFGKRATLSDILIKLVLLKKLVSDLAAESMRRGRQCQHIVISSQSCITMTIAAISCESRIADEDCLCRYIVVYLS